MPGIYVGTSPIKSAYVGTTPVKEIYVGTNKVRPTEPTTFTIVWNETSNPSQFFVEYKDDAVGMTKGSSDWDTIFGYSAVLLDASGNEVEEVTQSSPGVLNFGSFSRALTGTANNVMIKFPRRGIKMSKSGTKVTLSITKEKNKSGYQYYAFTKGTTAKDYLYLGAFMGTFSNNNSTTSSSYGSSTYLKSWATKSRSKNFSPAASQSRATFRTCVARYGNGYSLMTIYPRWYINCLYMLKYGNPNSQTIVGEGSTASSDTKAPGTTTSQTSATYGTTDQYTQMKLFGLEDWWGSCVSFVDGCFINSSKQLTVDKTNNVFQDSAYSTNLGVQNAGYMTTIDGSNNGMFRNSSSTAGSETTYYTDMVSSVASRVVLSNPGALSAYHSAGVFGLGAVSTSYSDAGVGGRLQYL